MSAITTHVLDTSRGRPAAGIHVTLTRGDEVLFDGTTDQDGRARLADAIEPGVYRLRFDTGAWNPESFYPEAVIVFRVIDAEQHHHVPLLLSPFGYSTYRGS